MTTPNHRTAVAALDAARPLVARLDVATRHPDELAADIAGAWNGVETSLRALLGGSGLSGQALVSEVRQRGLLDYRHVHDVLAFLDARERVARPGHAPSEGDVNAARSGYQSLEAALGVGIAAPTGVHRAIRPDDLAPPPAPTPTARAAAARAAAAPTMAAGGALDVPVQPRRVARGPGKGVLLGLVALLAVAAAGLFWWLTERNDPRALRAGIAAYQSGNRAEARRQFEQAAERASGNALPHVYLARLAREDGDVARATTHAEAAIRADTGSALARREMGQLLLQTNRPDLAARFLTAAVERDPQDRVAMGWLACATHRLGDVALTARFAQRAGQGDWSGCLAAPPGARGALPPGAFPGAPPGVAPGALPGAPPPAPF